MRGVVSMTLVVAAAVAAAAPWPADWVERGFSNGIYPAVQRHVTPVTNAVPFAWLDVIVLGLLAGAVHGLVAAGRSWRQSRSWRVAGRHLAWWPACAAVLYLLFLGAWGLNYRRLPMGERVRTVAGAPDEAAAARLAERAVTEMNARRPRLDLATASPPWRDDELRRAFAEVQRLLGGDGRAVPGRLKASLFGPYFRWAGIDGMVNPFALEVIGNPDLLPAERPFVAAHEWGHLAGFADEAEASYVGWLACIRAGDAAAYSGWLFLYWQISAELDPPTRARLWETLVPEARRDVEAIVARLRRGEVRALRTASWQVYDQYLKANRVASGVRSYSAVVSLILRTDWGPGWTPVRR